MKCHRLPGQGHESRIRPSEKGELTDDGREPLDLLQQGCGSLTLGIRSISPQDRLFQRSMHDGERRFQLMGGVQGEFPRLGERESKPLLHPIENGGHPVQFIAIPAARHRIGEIRDIRHFQRFGQFLDRTQGATHEQPPPTIPRRMAGSPP